MATWIAHLRIAENLIKAIPGLDETLFAIGSIAPDSGIPDENWEHFNPPPEVTHFKPEKVTDFRTEDLRFYRLYLRAFSHRETDRLAFSFRLGYFFHLVTDNHWYRRIGKPTMDCHANAFSADRSGTWELVKNDWYGLDHIFVRENPNSLFWRIFVSCEYHRNDLEFLPVEAVQQRTAFIQEYYQSRDAEVEKMVRGPFHYLTKNEMDTVVEETTDLCKEAYDLLWTHQQDPGDRVSVLELIP